MTTKASMAKRINVFNPLVASVCNIVIVIKNNAKKMAGPYSFLPAFAEDTNEDFFGKCNKKSTRKAKDRSTKPNLIVPTMSSNILLAKCGPPMNDPAKPKPNIANKNAAQVLFDLKAQRAINKNIKPIVQPILFNTLSFFDWAA